MSIAKESCLTAEVEGMGDADIENDSMIRQASEFEDDGTRFDSDTLKGSFRDVDRMLWYLFDRRPKGWSSSPWCYVWR